MALGDAWQKSGLAKASSVAAYALDLLQNQGTKILVFAHHKAVMDALEQNLVRGLKGAKAMMAELSDGFVALPGGWGTIEEIFEMLTWAQLGHHEKPCGLLNVDSYYDELAAFLEKAIENRFVKDEFRPMMMIDESPGSLLDRFADYSAPHVRKWIGPEET